MTSNKKIRVVPAVAALDKPRRWVIGDPLPESVDLLPAPAQLATPGTTPEQQCCGVAPESGGENGDGHLNGSTHPQCPCGRPAPINPETGPRTGFINS